MEKKIVYVVDEDDAARRASCRELVILLGNETVEVESLAPFPLMSDYNELLANPNTVAFILDQRMKTSGMVSYDGTDLARHIRGIDSKIPIYILTGHPEDEGQFDGSNYLVEYIIGKDAIENPDSEMAITAKARILRHIAVLGDVRKEQEQRFHDLLVKSLREDLTPDEQEEMNRLEGETTAAVVAAERSREAELLRQIGQVRFALGLDAGQQ